MRQIGDYNSRLNMPGWAALHNKSLSERGFWDIITCSQLQAHMTELEIERRGRERVESGKTKTAKTYYNSAPI